MTVVIPLQAFEQKSKWKSGRVVVPNNRRSSSIDHPGRYAWGNQPQIAQWNLTRFAETLLPLIDKDTDIAVKRAEQSLDAFAGAFQKGYVETFAAKLGLSISEKTTPDFIETTLKHMTCVEIGIEIKIGIDCRMAFFLKNNLMGLTIHYSGAINRVEDIAKQLHDKQG